ncbi:hypothetical protein [Pseudodesulfovibrio piezophilus]|uniref:Putative pectate lyase protein n=1 Tax=Pseudodesulfovibrio piezophilus (strain DSM 21447 / JCM 15486 / C1TLV30) TaxID=1322246 RepID=M1WJ58_PSEP2|nr:hypothetical protein [Pseudodesulfovibrio piezophilus]CCH47321.1 putative pectate lyase protein [Pseudodesulfovibrio piezophilus C1TLV30]
MMLSRFPLLIYAFLLYFFPCTIASAVEVDDFTVSGGLVTGSNIIHVTSLDDDGPGTLREALEKDGPKIIVFEESGTILLKSDLIITHDKTTIAGETAPSPGIIIHNGSLHIRASDIVVSHVAIYPGSSNDPQIAENRDGISIYGSPSKNIQRNNILLHNVSVGWAVDENIGIQGLTDHIKIVRSLIAQPLVTGGHPKGSHSMNILLGGTVKRVIIVGSVLAGAEYRSPRLLTGNRVSFINNVIVGPGLRATHLDTSQTVLQPGAIDLIGNVYFPTAATKCNSYAIDIDSQFLKATPATTVHLDDNAVLESCKTDCLKLTNATMNLLAEEPVTQFGWKVISSKNVTEGVYPYVGSHPAQRNPIDAKVIRSIEDCSISLMQEMRDTGGYSSLKSIPTNDDVPISEKLTSPEDVDTMKAWLLMLHKRVTHGADFIY